MRTRSFAALAQVGLMILLTQGPTAKAAEIRVLSLPGFKAVMDDLGPEFERTSGHTLVSQFGLPAQLKVPLDAGEFDVRIVSSDILDAQIKLGKIVAGTRTDIGRFVIGVAVRAGAPKPDISSVAAFKQALLNAKSISYTKESGTGIYLASLMERLGIAQEIKPKTKLLGGGGQNPRAVSAGEVELGISVISDILPVRGAELLGPLPPELQNYSVVSGGVGAMAKQPEAASALIKFITAPAAFPVIKAKGMELLR